MIRLGEIRDRDAAVLLLRDSRAAAGFDASTGVTGFVFPFEPAYADRLFRAHVESEDGLCLVSEADGLAQGILMAWAAEHPFGPVRLARETVWWIDPGHRGSAAPRMLDAYEAWAREQGCAYAGMAGMGEDPDVAKLYLRRGYRCAETHFLKPL